MRKLSFRAIYLFSNLANNYLWVIFQCDCHETCLRQSAKATDNNSGYFGLPFFNRITLFKMSMLNVWVSVLMLLYRNVYFYLLFRYVLMCIHFLQQRRPAILPCLQVYISCLLL